METRINILRDEKVALSLFERVPDTIFRPLAAQNRQLYWDLLLRLYEQFYGPDAPPPPDDGYLTRTIVLDIERFVSMREWIESQGEVPSDGPSGRAHQVLHSLLDAGWLQEERVGARTFLVMKPTVQKFLELLKQFAEEGPQFIGGKVQIIFNQLTAVQANPSEQAAGFHESAKEARALIATLNATNMRVREAMDLLSTHDSTADFIRAFFGDYIANLYIRDYHELRTDNHPLRHRWEILQVVYELREDGAARTALVSWYQTAFKTASRERAEDFFEKDVARFLQFAQIEDYLERLDNSVNRTTRRALAYLQYKMRTRDRIDRLLEQSFEAFEKADAAHVPLEWPLARGPLFAEERLRDPKVAVAPVKRVPIRQPQMTPQQRALKMLRQAIARNREVSSADLVRYVEAHVPKGAPRDAETLPILSIKDLCLFAALGRLALASAAIPETRQNHQPYLRDLKKKGISLQILPGERVNNDYVTAPNFRVRR